MTVKAEDRLKGNKVIAIYIDRQLQGCMISDFYGEIPDQVARMFKYHRLYDWLLPVVKKLLEDLKQSQKFVGSNRRMISEIKDALVDLEILPLWEKVIEGIELLKSTES